MLGLGDYTQVADTEVITHVIEEQRNTPRKTHRQMNTGQDEPEQNTSVNEPNQTPTVKQKHNRNGLRHCDILWFYVITIPPFIHHDETADDRIQMDVKH